MFTNAQKKNSFNNKAFAGFLSKQYKKKKKKKFFAGLDLGLTS